MLKKQKTNVFPSRKAVASENWILNQVVRLNLLRLVYPKAYSKSNWKELFSLTEARLKSFNVSKDRAATEANLAELRKKVGI